MDNLVVTQTFKVSERYLSALHAIVRFAQEDKTLEDFIVRLLDLSKKRSNNSTVLLNLIPKLVSVRMQDESKSSDTAYLEGLERLVVELEKQSIYEAMIIGELINLVTISEEDREIFPLNG